ncbi:hypothetical protein HF086_004929 [Spodoptera exigua]|uniref:Uncharacterized protein n=1 Tax=Spodoptera exigua TaxID=7107 RepID=A0A922MU25_SPOEX|nr:hypothetical protein HF086_004929 [Spodoptera exigua]
MHVCPINLYIEGGKGRVVNQSPDSAFPFGAAVLSRRLPYHRARKAVPASDFEFSVMADGEEAGGDDAASDEAANMQNRSDLVQQQPSKAPKVYMYTFEELKTIALDVLMDPELERHGYVYPVGVQKPKLDPSDVALLVK